MEENQFYIYFQKEFEELFQKSVNQRLIFCLPPNIQMRVIKKNFGSNKKKMNYFINCHLLRESKYYANHYISTAGKILLKQNDILTTKIGFSNKFSIKILRTEFNYTKDFQPYPIWYVDKCLISGYKEIQSASLALPIQLETNVSKFKSLEQMKENLTKLIESKVETILTKKLQNRIKNFNDSYILINGFEKQVFSKLNQIFSNFCKEFKLNLINKKEDNGEVVFTLCIYVRSIIESGCYRKLFSYLQNNKENKNSDFKFYNFFKFYEKKEKGLDEIQKKKFRVQILRQFDVPEHFCFNYEKSVENFKKINTFTNTIEKLGCVQKSLDLMRKTIFEENRIKTDFNSDNSNPKIQRTFSGGSIFSMNSISEKKKKFTLLTTDDIIPLFAFILIRSKLKNLSTNLYFMNNLCFNEIQNTESGYNLVCLSAAVQFLEKEINKEMSLSVKNTQDKYRKSWNF